MPNINDAFPSKYLKASDLGDSQPVVTIDHVKFEPVGRDREMKAVVYFKGKEKGIVLNKTNANKITQIAGSSLTEDWESVQIRIYATETEFAGETVECIRVKAVGTSKPSNGQPPQPPPPPPPSQALSDDDIPFAWMMPFILPAIGLLSAGVLLA